MKIETRTELKLKILRLRQGLRYVVALQREDMVIPEPFWTEVQALMSQNIPTSDWAKVTTEVFAAIHLIETPSDVQLFVKSTRRGRVNGVIVWSKTGIHPKVFPTLADAVAVARAQA